MTGKHVKSRQEPFRQAHACDCGDHGFVGLTRGKVAIFDVAAIPKVAPHLWNAKRMKDGSIYAESRIDGQQIGMHRWFCGLGRGDGQHVDHRNGDTLENRSTNLRPCSPAENIRNARAHLRPVKFKGVHLRSSKWHFEIQAGPIRERGFGFATAADAARAYDAAAVKLHGQFARTNAMLGLFDGAN